MFDIICIKSKDSVDGKLDIGFLAETLIFYQKVVLIVHKQEIVTLLKFFGEDLFEELLLSGTLEIHIKENHIGSMVFPIGKGFGYNVDIMTGSTHQATSTDILYQAHREIYKNSIINNNFTARFAKLTSPFKYPSSLIKQIQDDFSDSNYFLDATDIYIKSIEPSINIDKTIPVEVIKNVSYGPFDAFTINTSLDLEVLTKKIHSINPSFNYTLDFGSILLTLAEARGNIFLASQFDSEIATSAINSELIKYKFDHIYSKRKKSETNIESFYEYQLKDFNTIGEAFRSGERTASDLINLLNKSNKFKAWLKDIPDNKDFVREFYKEVSSDTWVDKLPNKTIRFLLFNAIGLAVDLTTTGGVATAISLGLSAGDALVLDKFIKGWKPNQFVDKNLKPILKK